MSTQSFAFSKFNGTTLERWGSVQYKGRNTFERLADGQEKLLALKPWFADIECVIFEGSVYVQNKSTVILLAYAYGMAVSAILPKGADIEQVAPITWQSAIGNKILTPIEKNRIKAANPGKTLPQYKELNRQFRKQRTIDWVNNKFGIFVNDDNIADAIGVGAFQAGVR
jgi:hypothetical protein